MLARLRARLTYANVVATLALFVALGGSSYAALSITSKDVKNRSLKGGDLRKDTITGTEIRESRLRQVPSALNATNAGTAGVADIANDARALAGQGAGAFEKSSRVQFGRAPAAPAGPPNEQVLFSWPELGAEVRSSSQDCGANARFAVRSTKSAGGGNLEFNVAGSAAPSVPPGATERECSPNASVDSEITDSSGRTLFVDCITAQGELRCVGIRSEP